MDELRTDAFRKSLGLVLQRARDRRQWSRQELLAHSGVSPATIVAIEGGARGARLETLLALAEALRPADQPAGDYLAQLIAEAYASC